MPTIHDPIFGVPVRPMFPWGKSPFRARGMMYRDTVASADELLRKRNLRLADVLRANGDPGFEAFFNQRFASTDWYDVYPAIHLAPLVAKARGVSIAQHTRDAGAIHAQQALRGFTSVVLKLVSNEIVASWLPRVSAWYHDFGTIDTQVTGERIVRGVRSGLPVFAVHGWSVVGMHFTENVLAHAGAKNPRAVALNADPDGVRDGCPLYRVRFEIGWEA